MSRSRGDIYKTRWALYDVAIRAGREATGDFWPELASLTTRERKLVHRLIQAERNEGGQQQLPSDIEALERAVSALKEPNGQEN